MPFYAVFLRVLLFILCLALASCNKKKSKTANAPVYTKESPYCSGPQSFATAVTITGTGEYLYRTSDGAGLGAVAGTAKPIRYAEVQILNEANQIIQCGETDNLGQFSLTAPTTSATYTVRINSRGDNIHFKASVLKTPFDNPVANTFYSVSTTFTPDSSKSVGIITAPATGSLEGGAFFILDTILDTNEYLVANTSSCASFNSTFNSQSITCTPYAPSQKVQTYWKPGFNPNEYLGNTNDGLSFFTPSDGKLYILGGVKSAANNVDNTDTDHFDPSIIVHEYGHFIESKFAKSDSPGGEHNGTAAIDPRLAWGEGWADFLQAAVTNVPYYRDTIGNESGTKTIAFNISTEFKCNDNTNTPGGSNSCWDMATQTGEGNFREFSITRLMWDIIDPTGTGEEAFDDVAGSFDELWVTFTAFSYLNVNFRNVGLFHEIHDALGGTPANLTSLRNSEFHEGNRKSYANPVTSPSCSTSIATSTVASAVGTQLAVSHDFYHYNHTATGPLSINLTYNTSGGKDMDIFIYKEDHILGNTTTMVNWDDRLASADLGNINLSLNIAAGQYLIDVQYYSGSGSLSYTLTGNGNQICPTF